MKRIIALFLCLIMLCTVIPSSVFADDVDTTIGNAETVITEMAETPQEPTEPVEETVTDALVADEEPVKLNAKRSVPDAPMTEQETAEVAVETFDASVAGDGSITCYAVPNGDGTHSLYFFGTGVVADITSSNYRWRANYQNTTTYVYIGEGITETGNNMLNGFSVLEKVDLPSTLIRLKPNSFSKCASLESVVLPDGLESIGVGSFSLCTSLKTIDIPASVTTIGDSCFYKCDALQSINCSDNLTSVGKSCFYGCSALESITLSKNVKEYPKNCFYGTTALKSITFPTDGITLGQYCFSHAGVETINFENIAIIGTRCFADSELSGEVVIPTNCDVYDGAFSACNNLKKVTYKNIKYNIPNAFVHEDITKMYQSDINDPRVQKIEGGGICNFASVMTGLNTLAHLNYTVDSMAQEIIDSEYGITMFHQYTICLRYIAEHYGIETSASAGYYGADKIAQSLSDGKLVYIKVSWDQSNGHGYILWGITEDGYVYASDPAYPDMAPTQMDLSLFTATTSHNGTYHGGNYTAYDMSYFYDLSIKADDIKTSASVAKYPDSYTFTANEGEKVGTVDVDNAYLGKSSDWISYEDGDASTSLRFAYTSEPTDYIYVLDYSDSMTKSTIDENYTNMSIEKTVAYEAIEDLLASNGEARVSVVNFRGADEASYTEFTSNPEDLYDAIADATCQGFTSYADGFNAALEAANSRTGDDANRKTVVVFVSDGDEQWWINDEASGSYLPYKETKPVYLDGTTEFGIDEATALREAGAEIYSVILNPAATETAINNMAGITGDADKVYTATTIDRFAEALVDIVDSNTIRSFVLTDSIGEDFNYNGNFVAADGTTAVIDEANRTITWTLDNILPNTEYTLSFDIQSKKDSSGQFVCGDLPTNLGNAVVKEGNIVVNEVETPVLHRDPVLVDDGAQAHMIHKYTDLKRADNPALYTDGIRFVMDLNMKELQDAYEPGDKLAFGIAMLPLDKLQNGQTTNYLTMNVGAAGQLSSNGSYSFVNNTSAISSSKKLVPANMITWTEAMENCTTPTAFAQLLRAAGMSIFDVTDTGIQYSVYMMFSNASTRQAQANREIAYRGIMVSYDAQDGYAVKYSFQRNNSATRIYNHYNCLNYNVINVKGATAADMLHGESEYNPSYEAQAAAQ